MVITEADVADLVARVDAERDGWVNGIPPESVGRFEQDDDMTIVGPFGGRGVRGRGEFGGRQTQLVSQFQDGFGTFELIKTIVEGDLVVVIGIERNRVRIGDDTEPRPWVLRTTQVFRRRGDAWVRLHRHADPLATVRSIEETYALCADAAG